MTELELRNSHAPAHLTSATQPPAPQDAMAALRVWAETAQTVGAMVEQIVDTPFMPAGFRPKVDPRATLEERQEARGIAVANGTAAVLFGTEIGLGPMQALNNVVVINGRPGLYAETMVALVQAAGHEIWTELSTADRAVVHGRRAGRDKVETGDVTMADAKRAGWTRNELYAKDPVAMLYARAASRACRRTAPEVIKGIATVQELQDQPEAPAMPGMQTSLPPAVQAPVSVAELTAAPTPTPEPDPAPVPEPEAPPAEPTEQQVQLNHLTAALHALGVTDRGGMLRVCSHLANRPLESARDLTEDETFAALDSLALYAEAGDDGRAQIAVLAADPAPLTGDEDE
jgi:hypothetical protein